MYRKTAGKSSRKVLTVTERQTDRGKRMLQLRNVKIE